MGTKVPLLGTDDIADKAITNQKLADNSVSESKIADGSVTTAKIADTSVTTQKLSDNSVTTQKIADGSITNPKIAPDAVTTDKIATAQVQERNIAPDSVTTPKLVNASVTTPKIADACVTNAKMAPDTLTLEKFDPELRNAIKAATGLPEDLIKMIQDVDQTLDTLNDTVFPISLGFSVSPNVNSMSTTINYFCSCKGQPFLPDTLTIAKAVDDESTLHILADKPVESGSVTTPIEGAREVFTYTVGKEGRTGKSTSQTRYLCYYGGNSNSIADVAIMQNLSKVSTTGVSYNPKVTTKDGEYIWLMVPKYLTINKVTCAGFDVTLEDPQTLGPYKAYRTKNTLTANTWSLVIS